MTSRITGAKGKWACFISSGATEVLGYLICWNTFRFGWVIPKWDPGLNNFFKCGAGYEILFVPRKSANRFLPRNSREAKISNRRAIPFRLIYPRIAKLFRIACIYSHRILEIIRFMSLSRKEHLS